MSEVTLNQREWTEVPENGYIAIGKPGLPRRDGFPKLSGKAVYPRDIYLPGMLYAKVYRSPYTHRKIKTLDTSKVETFPGVKAVLRYDDPDVKDKSVAAQYYYSDYILPGTAYWNGCPMGFVVCADSVEICDQALKLVDIEWEEELPFNIKQEDALKENAPLSRPDQNPNTNLSRHSEEVHGDIDAGFAEADKTIEFQMVRGEGHSTAVEPPAATAVWNGDYLEAWMTTQCIEEVHEYLAKLNPLGKTKVHGIYSGASFGGWTWRAYMVIMPHIATILAKRTGKPVKFLYDQGKFHTCGDEWGTYDFKIGFKNNGLITAVKTYNNARMGTAIEKILEGSKIKNYFAERDNVLVNRSPDTCFRHGMVASAVQNAITDHVAAALGMDPIEVVAVNDGCEGHDMATEMAEYKRENGFPDKDSLKDVLDAGKKAIDWDSKWHAPGTKVLANGKYHGMGFVWSIAWQPIRRTGGSSAGLIVRNDGTVNIITLLNDFGVSRMDSCCRIVADEMGMAYEDVFCKPEDNVGFGLQDHGSSLGITTDCPVMVKLGRQGKEELLKLAVKKNLTKPALFPDLTPDKLDIKNSVVFEKANPDNKKTVKEIVSYHWFMCVGYQTNAPVYTWAWNGGDLVTDKPYCMGRQAHFCEIEVDPDTGEIDIKKVVNVNDVGKAINPDAINGQQYGGTYMGLGMMCEDIYYDPMTGARLNDDLINYPILTMQEIGSIDCIIVEDGFGYGPYGINGVGESTAAVTRSLIGPAVYNAIGKRVDDWPITPDKILKALGKI